MNYLALGYGSAAYSVLYIIHYFLINHFHDSDLIEYSFGTVSFAVCGYIAARIAGVNHFLHGATIGLVVNLVRLLGVYIIVGSSGLSIFISQITLSGALYTMLICGIGGAIASVWPRTR